VESSSTPLERSRLCVPKKYLPLNIPKFEQGHQLEFDEGTVEKTTVPHTSVLDPIRPGKMSVTRRNRPCGTQAHDRTLTPRHSVVSILASRQSSVFTNSLISAARCLVDVLLNLSILNALRMGFGGV